MRAWAAIPRERTVQRQRYGCEAGHRQGNGVASLSTAQVHSKAARRKAASAVRDSGDHNQQCRPELGV